MHCIIAPVPKHASLNPYLLRHRCGSGALSVHLYRHDRADNDREVRQKHVHPTCTEARRTTGQNHLSVLTDGDAERDAATVHPSMGCWLLPDIPQQQAICERHLQHQCAQLPDTTLADSRAIQLQRRFATLSTHHPSIREGTCARRHGRVTTPCHVRATHAAPRHVTEQREARSRAMRKGTAQKKLHQGLRVLCHLPWLDPTPKNALAWQIA